MTLEIRHVGPEGAAAIRSVVVPAFEARPRLDPPAAALSAAPSDAAAIERPSFPQFLDTIRGEALARGIKASTVIDLTGDDPEVIRVGCGDPAPFMAEAYRQRRHDAWTPYLSGMGHVAFEVGTAN